METQEQQFNDHAWWLASNPDDGYVCMRCGATADKFGNVLDKDRWCISDDTNEGKDGKDAR